MQVLIVLCNNLVVAAYNVDHTHNLQQLREEVSARVGGYNEIAAKEQGKRDVRLQVVSIDNFLTLGDLQSDGEVSVFADDIFDKVNQ